MHYHFATKQRLLLAAAERLCADRSLHRAQLFAQDGLAALDAAWATVERAAADGETYAWQDLLSLGRTDTAVREVLAAARASEANRLAQRLPALLRSLGAASAAAPDEVAQLVLVVLDGAAAALLAGTPGTSVRSAFDAFWLVLIGAGQTARR